MTDVLDTAAEALRRAGLRVFMKTSKVFLVDLRGRRFAAVCSIDGRHGFSLWQYDDRCVAEYAVTEWTPRHTSAVQAWLEEAIVDEDLGGEVEG